MQSISLPNHAKDILKLFSDAGFEAYVVGGCVRDSLRGVKANDWDICTAATPEETKAVLSGGFKLVETGIKHGTVMAIRDGVFSEITTFRSDGEYVDNRHPSEVFFTRDIKEDLSRRDFTVNAMAYSPDKGLIDLFDGCSDLEKGIIRCVGMPERRFNEDALRIMRALRFSSKLGFEIESDTASAVLSCRQLLLNIAAERINAELSELICGDNAESVLCEYKSVFELIFNLPSVFEDWDNKASKLSGAKKNVAVRLALLFSSELPDDVYKLLKSLKYDNKTISDVVFLLRNRELSFDSEVGIKKAVLKHGKENMHMLSSFRKSLDDVDYAKAAELIDTAPLRTLKDLAVNGNDIIDVGISSGPEIKRILAMVCDAVIEGKIRNTKDDILDFVKRR